MLVVPDLRILFTVFCLALKYSVLTVCTDVLMCVCYGPRNVVTSFSNICTEILLRKKLLGSYTSYSTGGGGGSSSSIGSSGSCRTTTASSSSISSNNRRGSRRRRYVYFEET